MNKVKDIIGKTFGYLTVVKRGPKHPKKTCATWICKCDCSVCLGKICDRPFTGWALRSGHTKSCGTLCSEAARGRLKGKPSLTRVQDPGIVGWTGLLRGYKDGAKRRGLDFSLSKEEFEKLCSSDCYYCGQIPSRTYSPYFNNKHQMHQAAIDKGIDESHALLTVITVNGIDRIDNNIGYILNNCVSCCHLCNFVKGARTVDDFYQHALNVCNTFEKHKEKT